MVLDRMEEEVSTADLKIVRNWCSSQGNGWRLIKFLGKGGTASVFELTSPTGPVAFKLYDKKFSSGELGNLEEDRIGKQLDLKGHGCPYLVEIYDGGRVGDRLFLLMGKPEGDNLESCLSKIPRGKIRSIIDQVARAVLFLRDLQLCHRDIKSSNIIISSDYNHATLLDLAVTRDIYDPVGLGTDHDGGLPIVATARYCPPEYLFRLIEPGPELWHALDVYQLGALLFDLITRKSLFSEEDKGKINNRYRFAWTIATKTPTIIADDVDTDLIFLARRALSKDWKSRTVISIEDFMIDETSDSKRALAVIGLFNNTVPKEFTSIATRSKFRNRLNNIADSLHSPMIDFFRSNHQRVTHKSEINDANLSASIKFRWEINKDEISKSFEFCIKLIASNITDVVTFNIEFFLTMSFDGQSTQASIPLGPVQDDTLIIDQLVESAKSSVGALAIKLTRVSQGSLQ